MILNENEDKDAVRRLGEQEERLKQQAVQLKQTKLFKNAIKRVLDPVRSFHEQIKDEVASHERLKRGEFDELQNFAGIGRLLIALRIAKGADSAQAGRAGPMPFQCSYSVPSEDTRERGTVGKLAGMPVLISSLISPSLCLCVSVVNPLQ